MANILDTLHPEGHLEDNLYPNILAGNIPSGVIGRDKLTTEVNNMLKQAGSSAPAGAAASNTILAYTYDRGLWVGTDTGKWYYWDGSKYVVGGNWLLSVNPLEVNGISTSYIQNENYDNVLELSGSATTVGNTDYKLYLVSNELQIDINDNVAFNAVWDNDEGKGELSVSDSWHMTINDINNANGNAMVRYKSTENKVVLGGSTIPTTIMGSGDRPTYSKNGSDFSGNPLALKSDVDTNWDLLMANLGIGRWANQTFYGLHWDSTSSHFYDEIMPYYTSYARFMCGSEWRSRDTDTKYNAPMTFDKDFNLNAGFCDFTLAFSRTTCSSIELPNLKGAMFLTFCQSPNLTKITIKKGCTVTSNRIGYAFSYCPELTEIPEIDISNAVEKWAISGIIYASPKVKSIHIKHFKFSFDISPSTAFEEADLVEIISNLDKITTTQTLTMGATNLAKLTDEEKKVATDKGWVLA